MAYNSVTLNPSNGRGYTLAVEFYESINDDLKLRNISKIDAKLALQANGTYWATSHASELILYWHDNKNNADIRVGYLSFAGLGGIYDSKVVSASFEVEHKSDGTLSGYAWGTFNKGATTAQQAPSSGSVYIGWTNLTTIPRATKLANQILTIGELANISWTKASSTFTHTLTYEFGELTGTIGEKLVDSVSWTPPEEFYEVIKDAPSGTGKLKLTTYSGTTKIGDTQTATMTINPNINDSKPVIIESIIRDENTITNSLTGDNSVLILNKSLAFVELVLKARKYAKISKVTVNGVELSLGNGNVVDEQTTQYQIQQTIGITTSGTFKVVITDTRGFVTEGTIENDVINYIELDVKSTFKRIQPTTGEIGLEFDGNYFNQSFGDIQNTLRISYMYKQQYEDEYSEEILLDEDVDYKIVGDTFYSGDSDYKREINLGSIFDYKKVYNFVLYVEDKLTKLVINALVVKGIPIFWWNGEKVTINGDLYIADEDGNNPINVKNMVGGGYDSLPVGSIINFDGDEVPVGYEEISEINDKDLLLNSNNIINFTPTNGTAYENFGSCYYYKKGTRVHIHLGLSGLSNSNTRVFTLPAGYRPYTTVGGVSLGDSLLTRAGYEVGVGGAIVVNSAYGYMLADIEYDAFA